MTTPQLTASIVVYRHNPEELRKVINCFLYTQLDVELYLVANSSSADLSSYTTDPRVKLIISNKNLGFGRGHNLAIAKATNSQYYLVLNPDISFEKGVLEELYHFMEQHRDVGNVIPKVYHPDGRLQRIGKLLPDPITLFYRRFLPDTMKARKLNQIYELKSFNYDNILAIPNLSGCFMFIRNAVLQKTGGFDERFFLYLEDIDLNRRIGHISKTVFYPYVSIIHRLERGSYKSFRLLLHHLVSAIKYFNKWGWFFDDERKKINSNTINSITGISGKLIPENTIQ